MKAMFVSASVGSVAAGWRITRCWLVSLLWLVVGLAPALTFPAAVAAEAPGLATVAAPTPLLVAPAADAAPLATVAVGSEVELSGAAAPGYLEVSLDGQTGWIDAATLEIGGRIGIPLEAAVERLPILAAPMAGAPVLGIVPAGGIVILTGAEVGAYLAGSFDGTGGWIAEAGLGMPYDSDQSAS